MVGRRVLRRKRRGTGDEGEERADNLEGWPFV
jgi:hypothetical protein